MSICWLTVSRSLFTGSSEIKKYVMKPHRTREPKITVTNLFRMAGPGVTSSEI